MKRPLFSIIHTSARPDKCWDVYQDWMRNCAHPEEVEYVMVIDPRWGFSTETKDYSCITFTDGEMMPWPENLVIEVNTGRRCYVDGVNIGARASTGHVLIVNADDQFSAPNWDFGIRDAIANTPFLLSDDFVVEVSTGTDDPRGIPEHDRGIFVMPVLSRARYEKFGWVFYPEYESMCADNDFCEAARKDGVVIDGRNLMFPHLHPLMGKGEWDEAYAAQNRTEASQLGLKILARRRAAGFGQKRSIVLCLPGEKFEGDYLDYILDLNAHLLLTHDMAIARARHYTSNPAITREDIRHRIEGMNPKPDLIFWLDDDNLCSMEHFDRLLKDLDEHPGVDGVFGWCWIHKPDKTGFMPSCGMFSPDGKHWDPMPNWFANEQGLRPFECGGFPVALMRYSALEKCKPGGFIPIVDPTFEHGMSGEDLAFFIHAEEGGANFLVDPQVRVPHLKYVEVNPVFPSEGKVPAKIATMMRVKNEARWIEHTIKSGIEVSGSPDLVFIMEDGSTDGTREICERAGVVVLPSPFEGEGLNEERDKDWLLQEVIARCSPDWIFMPDGDEELEPGGADKLRRAVESNPACDCFALRFLYLWDSLDQIRIDGMYSRLQRQSLFRVSSDFHFSSIYTEEQTKNQNHVGLHCSNAPGLGGRVMGINVALLHYGYLYREDRINKYRWLRTIDPDNPMEDNYRHCVQGDIPEVPADAVLKHGGPLKLVKLPRHLRPKFDKVPGPRVINADGWATPATPRLEAVAGD